ncbi:MAG TPA: hypothetical protein VFZ09_26075 [Archangium sp.]|uniref:hypothetical protein n=1 Tax=Archangium sp. TaxID=1872627 RepID=UPI002E353C04|nr:hypothetical protein [Archangium sp.]HEX5749726.1 hypothetical protein [Archangium sp.]
MVVPKITIGTIRQARRNGEYEKALELIGLARQSPLDTPELLALSLYEGILLYEVGRFVESGDAFEMALLIRPEAKLPEPVSPKIESHFETVRKKALLETSTPTPPDARQKPSPGASSNCPTGHIIPNGRTLQAQQLWRLAMMNQMLCVRGIQGGAVAGRLSEFKAQVSKASSPTEWVRVIQEIDQFAREYSLYPFNSDWTHVKSLVPEERWELGDEDQDVALPEPPASADEEPASLLGCRAAVAPDCERLMRRLLLLQNQLPGVETANRFTARTELLHLGKKVREAFSSETLQAASRDIDAWQSRWH